jgi:hypothetical protein
MILFDPAMTFIPCATCGHPRDDHETTGETDGPFYLGQCTQPACLCMECTSDPLAQE